MIDEVKQANVSFLLYNFKCLIQYYCTPKYIIITHIQKMDNGAELSRFGSAFAQNYNSPTSLNLLAVFGHSKAGKSVTIDLLASKELILYEDVECGMNVVVEKDNCAAQYPPIYIAKGGQSTILLQSFTLDKEIQSKKIQSLKLIFLRQFVEQAERAAFILLIEEGQKEQILNHVERFLQFMGITEVTRDPILDIIKDCLYLMITKAEEELESTQEMFQELVNDCDNENVREIIAFLLKEKRIEEFKYEAPSSAFIKSIKSKFTPKPLNSPTKQSNTKRQLLNVLERSVLTKEEQVFSEEDEQYTLEILSQTTKMMGFLLLFASSGDRAHQRQYQALAKRLYPDHKRKNETETMLGKLNKAQVSKVSPSAKLAEIKNKDIALGGLIRVVIKIISDMQAYSEAKRDYEEIKGKLAFFQSITHWFQPSALRNQTAKIYQFLASTLQLIASNTEKISNTEKAKPQGAVVKPKASARQPSKKGNKQFNAFKLLIEERCSNNQEAIDVCLKIIKEKEKDPNYEYFQVIYYIKLLKDLFEQYDFRVPSDRHLFIKELMELALYSQNYFDFQRYLSRAIRSKALSMNDARTFMISLKKNGKYEACEQLADYLLAECSEAANFNRLAEFKANLKVLINKEYFKKAEDDQDRADVKKKELSFSMKELVAKGKGNRLDTFFIGKDFEQYLGNKE